MAARDRANHDRITALRFCPGNLRREELACPPVRSRCSPQRDQGRRQRLYRLDRVPSYHVHERLHPFERFWREKLAGLHNLLDQMPDEKTAMTDATTIRVVDQILTHPPTQVWRALTEPELIARWLMPGDFRLKVGHRYVRSAVAMPGTGFSGSVQAEALAFELGRMLRVRWRDADPDSASLADWTITGTLEPEGRGTRLFLRHEGFDPDNPLHLRVYTIMTGG